MTNLLDARPAQLAGTQAPLLSVRDLTVHYRVGDSKVALVNNAFFDIAPGEIVGLVGESGSGKSLTARAITGLLRRNHKMSVHGTIEFGQRDVAQAGERALRSLRGREIGMIFQDPVAALDPVVPIGRQVAEAITRFGSRRRAVRQQVIGLLDEVGISDPALRIHQYPHEISGGMCQRVLIAIALAGSPSLLIADEPTTALDVTIQAQVLDLIRRLRDERKMSVLFITHDMGVAAQIADRIVVMYAGTVVEAGTTRQFFARPSHPYSIGLVNAVPRVEGQRIRRLLAIPGSVPEARDRPAGCPFHPRCPVAQSRCSDEAPPSALLAGQYVACHRASEIADGTIVPWPTADGGGPSLGGTRR